MGPAPGSLRHKALSETWRWDELSRGRIKQTNKASVLCNPPSLLSEEILLGPLREPGSGSALPGVGAGGPAAAASAGGEGWGAPGAATGLERGWRASGAAMLAPGEQELGLEHLLQAVLCKSSAGSGPSWWSPANTESNQSRGGAEAGVNGAKRGWCQPSSRISSQKTTEGRGPRVGACG